ncbi:DUF2905 domain-containing protein [Paramaledivibacter caminithermalis]|jgi:hypothetical protein|uniref:DUF2905 domain-containing protein n=1 Tax=Paramaledivibacter caminithermalis (strain DSM 15212 / CIP 107654 / DViRD3) TaxID=1121301 RepID=A0A1M6QUX6_PARC5|nr:DUF2905 domain-containing protein [Paramaledivibacter caminithermalis]SHK23975.1 Protein of unknown function [Paramaledivibacter caminithermalis DSM 15212]
MESFGRLIITFGIIIIVIGLIITFGSKIGFGRLPGDIFIKKGNITFYFPILTCIIISILLTVIGNLFFRR